MMKSGDQLAALLRPPQASGDFLKSALALNGLAQRFVDALAKSNECHDPQTGEFCETGGKDEKQKSSHPGGVKGHVHELLASGQAYSIAELAQATGATQERVKFLLSRLQNPKYAAASKDALILVKEGEKYRVAGTKPALTSEEKKALKVKTEQAPIGTNQIGAHSFSGDVTKDGQFSQANRELNGLMEKNSDFNSAGALKHDIAEKLGADLADDHDWQKVAELSAKVAGEGSYGHESASAGLAARIISGWASTSADNDSRAKAMQLAARDEFEIKDAALGHMGIHSQEDENKIWQHAARMIMYGYDHSKTVTPEEISTFKSAMRAFTRAEYERTQAWFKEKGITEVSVFRGMKQPGGDPKFTTLHGQPLSSFSSSLRTATGFGSRIYMATFPVSHVVGSCQTGRGCLNERELVIIGHPIKAVRAGKSLFWERRQLEVIGAKAFGKKTAGGY